MGYEEMAADGGYGRIGTDENRQMAEQLERDQEQDWARRQQEADEMEQAHEAWAEWKQSPLTIKLQAENADLKEQLLLSQEAGRKSTYNTTEQQLDIPTQKGTE